MPNLDNTPNNKFRYPSAANNGIDFSAGFQDFADDIDAMWRAGALVARPAATAVPTNSVYLATDDPTGGTQGTLYRSDGSTWGLPNGTAFSSGLIAGRPVAGVSGRVYYATDTQQFFDDDGTQWNLRQSATSGSAIIASSQSTSSSSYTTLGTPDQVSGLVVPAGGLIEVTYQATWQSSVSDAPQAAIFLNSIQAVIATAGGGGPQAQAAGAFSGTSGANMPLSSCSFGLIGGSSGGGAYTGDATTGQIVGIATGGGLPLSAAPGGGFVAADHNPNSSFSAALGGPCQIFAAPGTYTVSIRFKTSSGSVTAFNRRLYARVISY